MGCKQKQKYEEEDPLPLINMLVTGFPNAGKSTIINLLKGESGASVSPELGIDTFIFNNRIKIIVFEVAGRAMSTCYHFYSTANIVLFIVDINKPQEFSKITQCIESMDKKLPDKARIIIAFNKIDLLVQSKDAVDQQASHFTEFLEKNNFRVGQISKLKLGRTIHDVYTCMCSGMQKIGITGMIKKIQSFGLLQVMGQNYNVESIQND